MTAPRPATSSSRRRASSATRETPRRHRAGGTATPETPRPQELTGSCHCGAIRVTLPARPRTLTACNCSICRRYGALWAYFAASRVRIVRARGAGDSYSWGGRRIRFVRCARCGCVTHWERTRPTREARVGVNARLFDPDALGAVRIRRLDGAGTWRYLD